MNLAWHTQALFVVLFLLFGLITVLVNSLTVRRLDQYPKTRRTPRVSVLVPARNEEHNIEACMTSLLKQEYPDFEVIVLDDHSTDNTLSILTHLVKRDNHLQIIEGRPLPDGWLGKHWACHQLDRATTGELILFVDADTRHTPDMLLDSVSALLAERADLVTAFPRKEMVTWGERLLVPVIGFGIFTFIPVRWFRNYASPRCLSPLASSCSSAGQPTTLLAGTKRYGPRYGAWAPHHLRRI